jgi:1-aminocyclopropane-1-carboxylate deaminase/D-cysteine desulfhydrase-like pyridoxal-dependent ACC family enzyme
MDRASETLGAEIWVKSEEACGTWGGNKVRKLEYILAKLERSSARNLVAYGAGTSSWAAAVALHAGARGYRVHLGLGGVVPDHYRELYRRTETQVHSFDSYTLTPLAAGVALAAAGLRGTARLPAGGSGLPGDVGSMNAGIEIAEQARSEMPAPRAIFVPAGTSGTAAGITVGTALGGLAAEVIAVRVTPRPLGTQAVVRYHVHSLTRRLRRAGVDVPAEAGALVRGEGRFFPPAYGAPTPQSTEAISFARADELELDPTYAAKAFAALIAAARAEERGPFLFLHTSPGPLPDR